TASIVTRPAYSACSSTACAVDSISSAHRSHRRSRTLKRAVFAVAAMMLAGCAGGQSGTMATPRTETVAVSREGARAADILVTSEAYQKAFDVPGEREVVFSRLPEAFEAVGLPAPMLDRNTWTAAVRDYTVQRRDRKSTRLNSSHVKNSYAV